MKTSKISKTVLALSTALFIMPLAGAAYGSGHGHGYHGDKGKGECTSERFESRAEHLEEALSLDEGQVALLETMHQSRMNFKDEFFKNNDIDSRPGKNLRRSFHLFRAELDAADPNFQAVGEKVKAEYQGEHGESFETAVDARVAFLSSLSAEQRRNMMEMKGHRGRHHKWQ
ncbi:MAG: hypothetical protein U9R66_11770 [Thermodesulfobacteriota bacterium]|nr:hypothetical protein [Thermodesulfobacteriota bacterium]